MSQTPEINNRILCVDDERGIVQAYVDCLLPAAAAPRVSSRAAAPSAQPEPVDEYVLLKAYSGIEAVEKIKAELDAGRRVAAGFFDVKMEGPLDGIQAIQTAWKLDPAMHCTIVTAYQDRSVQDINRIFGPDFKDQWDYMTKPFSQGEILQKARQMTAAWNRKRSLESALVQLKAAQEQLVHSERLAAIGQVARGVGHEFGNILQRIVGKADLALGEKDGAKVIAHVKIILEASERAAIIVRNLQSFSKKSAAASEKVQLQKVVRDTLALVGHELVKAKVVFQDQSMPDAVIQGDAIELQQVMTNLIINALHAMPNGGTLEVGCAEKDGAIEAWVADTGTGIPPEVLPRIFDYAFTTKGDRGSGLGLSISRQIVEKHGGTIEVRSTLGKGSAFRMVFPGAGSGSARQSIK